MALLEVEIITNERKGNDVSTSVKLSEDDGPLSTTLGITFHNVRNVVLERGNVVVTNNDGAPVIIHFAKPPEVPF